MNKEQVVRDTIHFVKELMSKEGSGHDWYHVERVMKLAQTLANEEGADPFICTMTSLLHDVADDKICKDVEAEKQRIHDWLTQHQLINDDHSHIISIIENMSFSKGTTQLPTLEGRIVQDADRLDAIGAIGIARCFVYSGYKGQLIYDPSIKVRTEMTKEQYRNEESTAINHFYEKLLKLKELMNTNAGKRVAEERHSFMEAYLEQFALEWQGKR
ncbi:HD domain-containing protein [Bacillus sp. FJAT-45350]|uniref:HD domain-containing protein n=1 Tax=Bacillus sp. FJAT-45350 TaxID=2011014 RepID=UPI000BB7669A|nr:HD domain-containing protein [Bacillus sp. FJAT-45350]